MLFSYNDENNKMNDINIAIILFFVCIISFILWKLAEKSSSQTNTKYVIGDEWNKRIVVFRNKQNSKDTMNPENIISLCTDPLKGQNKRAANIIKSLQRQDGDLDIMTLQKYIDRYGFDDTKELDIIWLRMDNENLLSADEFEILNTAFENSFCAYITRTINGMGIEKKSNNMGVQKLCIVIKGNLTLKIEDKGTEKKMEMKRGDAFTYDDTFINKLETDGKCIYLIFDVPRSLGAHEKTNIDLIKKSKASLTRFREDLDNHYLSGLYDLN